VANSYKGHLHAIDTETGNELWKFTPEEKPDSSEKIMGIPMFQVNAVPSSAVVAGGIVYFGSENGYLYALR
jgi:outer membrane protein assembly factor BamB